MKKFLIASLLSLAAALPAAADDQRNLVTILTAPEPQTQLMAMVLTLNAVQQGATAQILLCGPAGDIALNDAPATATTGQPPRDASPQGLMRMMMDQHDVKVEVCAIYLPGRGADASVLIDGVTPAAPDAAARAIIADDSVVMSF
jgi:sulfur relay (sulfurtransferase) complex TusBCD TusD component (DsrE family)